VVVAAAGETESLGRAGAGQRPDASGVGDALKRLERAGHLETGEPISGALVPPPPP